MSKKNVQIPDGEVTENYSNSENKILFILKESNISNSDNKPVFWFKKVYNAKKCGEKYYNHKNCNRVEKAAQTKYYNCIMGIVEKLYPNNQDIGIAYININKNGGGSTSDGKGVAEWLEEGSENKNKLSEQIEKLNPTKIVVFSCNDSNKLIQDFANELKGKSHCVYGADFHPSRYKKSDIENIENFKI